MSSSTFARHRRNLMQFVRFGIVGGSGVVVNMVMLFIMTRLHGGTTHDNDVLFHLLGSYTFRFSMLTWIIPFLVANTFNFQLNRSWTFKRDNRRSWWTEFWPFFAVGSVAAVAGIFIKWALTHAGSPVYLPSPWFNDHQGLRARTYWSQLITIIVTLPINFIVNRLWTFRAVKQHTPGADDLPMVAPVVDPDEVADSGVVIGDPVIDQR